MGRQISWGYSKNVTFPCSCSDLHSDNVMGLLEVKLRTAWALRSIYSSRSCSVCSQLPVSFPMSFQCFLLILAVFLCICLSLQFLGGGLSCDLDSLTHLGVLIFSLLVFACFVLSSWWLLKQEYQLPTLCLSKRKIKSSKSMDEEG